MSISESRFGVQISIGLVGRVVSMLIAFISAIFLARVLGPVGYGVFYVLMAVVAVLDNPVTGWANACRKRLTEEEFPAGEAVGSTLIGIGIASVCISILSFFLAPWINQVMGDSRAALLLPILYFGTVSYVTTLQVLKASAKFGWSQWMIAGRDVLRVAGQAGLVVIGFGVAGMVGGMTVANLLVAPVVLYLIGFRPEVPTRETLADIWQFARSSIPNGFVATVQSRMDTLLLGFLATPGVVGNYEVAFRLTMPAMFVAGITSSGLMGRVSNKRSKGKTVRGDVQNSLSYVSIIAIPLFIGTVVMGEPVVVTVFSSQYADAGLFVAGLALFRLLRSQKVVLTSAIDGFDRPDLTLRISFLVFVLNIILGVGLLFQFGPVGVVIATVLSEVVGYLAAAYVFSSMVPTVSLLPRPLIDQLLSGFVMGVGVVGLRRMVRLNWWGPVIFLVGAGAALYFITLIIISESFRVTVRGIARDIEIL